MQGGNWVPISKALVKMLPTRREYSEVEAMFSISVDYDCNKPASVAGYASLWGWSRKRVSNFLNKYGLVISYDENKFDRHKKGQVALQVGNRMGTGKGHVEFIDSKVLRGTENRRGTGREQEGNRKGSTTNDPNPNPKEEDIVETPSEPRPQIPFKQIVSYLNEKTNRSFNHSTGKTQNCIRARWNEGFRSEDFKLVIDHKVKEWLTSEDYARYLRPETLFGTKFEGYLQDAKQRNQPQEQSRWNRQAQQADRL